MSVLPSSAMSWHNEGIPGLQEDILPQRPAILDIFVVEGDRALSLAILA
jgi:hypothetical protein